MKRILITGKNSYVGTNVEKWLMKEPDKYYVESISVRGEEWKSFDFSKFDVVFHVAGIAHVSSSKKMKDLYFKINKDLTVETVKRAKDSGVKQFIFMSSIIVYGESRKRRTIIAYNTIPKSKNFYGMSKLLAEDEIVKLYSENIKIAILRSPFIYGKESKGNYQKLSKLARITSFFPDFENRRSMIHIDNLCEFIRLLILNQDKGIYFPQNEEYVKTSEMVKQIAEFHGNRIVMFKWMNWIILLLMRMRLINKLFGDYIYDKSMSQYSKSNYQLRTFNESINLTEIECGNQ